MKTTIFFAALITSALSFSACNVNDTGQTAIERERVDSMERSNKDLHNRLDNAKTERRESEARTKEAILVEKNARNASTESRKTLRAEKKAQKSRSRADEQARKTRNTMEGSKQDQ